MTALTLITAQTAAVTVAKVFSITEDDVPATLMATNLAGSEVITILFTIDDGGNTESVFQDGSVVTLSATDKVKSINSPGRYAVTKPVTVGISGVFLAKKQSV